MFMKREFSLCNEVKPRELNTSKVTHLGLERWSVVKNACYYPGTPEFGS